MPINDGGSAFPEIATTEENENRGEAGGRTYSYGGMTLRDYFAGQALAGMCAAPGSTSSASKYAKASYILADEMIVAREAK